MTTNMRADLTYFTNGRTVQEKSDEFVSAADFGASPSKTAAENTAAINAAILSVGRGYVWIPKNVAYTATSINFTDTVVLISPVVDGCISFLTNDFGNSPVAKGGIAIKQKGRTGVLLRGIDYGVTTDPLLQLVDLASGDIAGVNLGLIEVESTASQAAPSTGKCRLYLRDGGGGDYELVARFATGSPIPLVAQSSANLTAEVVYDAASLADGDIVSTNVTVVGAAVGDFVAVSLSTIAAGIMLHASVISADTVNVVIHNRSGAAVDMASGTLKVKVTR